MTEDVELRSGMRGTLFPCSPYRLRKLNVRKLVVGKFGENVGEECGRVGVTAVLDVVEWGETEGDLGWGEDGEDCIKDFEEEASTVFDRATVLISTLVG